MLSNVQQFRLITTFKKKRYKIPKEHPKIDNPEKLAT
jgi:hypothetical protein